MKYNIIPSEDGTVSLCPDTAIVFPPAIITGFKTTAAAKRYLAFLNISTDIKDAIYELWDSNDCGYYSSDHSTFRTRKNYVEWLKLISNNAYTFKEYNQLVRAKFDYLLHRNHEIYN